MRKAARHPYSIDENTQKTASPPALSEERELFPSMFPFPFICPCHLSLDNLIFNGLLFLIPLGSFIMSASPPALSEEREPRL